jgi:hypothetical protein
LRGDVKEQIQHLNDRADRIVALELAVEKQKEMIDNKDQYVGQLEFMVEQAEASAGNYKIGKERMADRHQAEIKGILKAIKALK